MSITTQKGIVISDEQLEQIAASFERGEWPGSESHIVRGRPLLFNEELQSITFKVPARKAAAIDLKAAALELSRSDYLRSLIDKDLALAN